MVLMGSGAVDRGDYGLHAFSEVDQDGKKSCSIPTTPGLWPLNRIAIFHKKESELILDLKLYRTETI